MIDKKPDNHISAREAFKKMSSVCKAAGIQLHCTDIPPTPLGSTSSLGPEKQDEVDSAEDQDPYRNHGITIDMDILAVWEKEKKKKINTPLSALNRRQVKGLEGIKRKIKPSSCHYIQQLSSYPVPAIISSSLHHIH